MKLMPSYYIEVCESQSPVTRLHDKCIIGEEITFSTQALESYFLSNWEALLFDALLVAAAVEFCDRLKRRPQNTWSRDFALRIPVHSPKHWNNVRVKSALISAVSFLTGDHWNIDFYQRYTNEPSHQRSLPLEREVHAIIPFSDGLDSCAVAGILRQEFGDSLALVRCGTRPITHRSKWTDEFVTVPFNIKLPHGRSKESSGRFRGFKFATLAAVAAKMAGAQAVYLPESGQGIFGPSILIPGQMYPDYRNHPLFLRRMETYFQALLGWSPRFEFPRMWATKAETLTDFLNAGGTKPELLNTRSCWRGPDQVGLGGVHRQCGACAACLLRRMSLFAAGIADRNSDYIIEHLDTSSLEKGAALGTKPRQLGKSTLEYAIAGVQHHELMSNFSSCIDSKEIQVSLFGLSRVVDLSLAEVQNRFQRLLTQHSHEWNAFLSAQGQGSFLQQWRTLPE